jgi:hypothetical protein
MKKLIMILATINCQLSIVNSFAQSISRNVISSAGGSLTDGNNIITYNIGETVISTLSTGSNTITQGFEQPGEELHTGPVAIPICAGSTVTIPYSAIDIGGGNIFTAQLSDAGGSFAIPINIGTQTGNASGNIHAGVPPNIVAGTGYRVRVISSYPAFTGADNGISLTINICGLIVNLKLFLQGYYLNEGTMQPVLTNQGVAALATETDTLVVELHDALTYTLIDSKQAILLTNGSVSANFTQPPGSYYIAVKHRNSIQTWTNVPVACTTTTPLYDFSTAAGKAFADNQVLVEPGIWAFYTGDLNQDGFIDGNDFPVFDNDSFNGVTDTYTATDMNGDGFVDGNDFPVFDNNSFNGVTAVFPH